MEAVERVLEAMLSKHRAKNAQDAKTLKKQGKLRFFNLPRGRLGGILEALGDVLELLGGILEALGGGFGISGKKFWRFRR